MKKRTFLSVFLLVWLSIGASAQFYVGPKASFQLYKTTFFDKDTRDSLDSKFKPGYNIGFFVKTPLKNNYELVFEFAFTRRGRKILVDDGNMTHISRYNFIEAPLLLRRSFEAHIIKDLSSTFFVELGPNVTYWLGGNGSIVDVAQPIDYDIVFGPKTGDTTDEIMYIDNANRVLFGLEFGVGFSIQTRKLESITTELRYTHGHTFLGDPDSAELNNRILGFTDNMQSNYRVINLSFAYNFVIDVKQLKKGSSVSDKSTKGGKKRK